MPPSNDYDDENKILVNAHIDFMNNSVVEDHFSNVKTRGKYQQIFADYIKMIYNQRCCVSGISTRSLLEGAHIMPWGKEKKHRINLNNGLCLSVLIHKCYDMGWVSIDENFIFRISNKIDDNELKNYLSKFNNKIIQLPVQKEFTQKKNFLIIISIRSLSNNRLQ